MDSQIIKEYIQSDANVLSIVEEKDSFDRLCFLINFKRDLESLNKIETIKSKTEHKFCIYIYVMYDQIGDQLSNDDWGEEICIDFYCFEDKSEYIGMLIGE